jgi:hypothetical protein
MVVILKLQATFAMLALILSGITVRQQLFM